MVGLLRAGALANPHLKPEAQVPALDLQRQVERLMTCLRVAVIFGGDKSELGSVMYRAGNSRNWKSYEPVAEDIAGALRALGFRHVELMSDDMTLPERLRRAGTHFAWLNTGGVQGYDPTAHASAMLELMGVPYVGHDPLAASVLDSKHLFKAEALCAGLPTAPFTTWHMSHGGFHPDGNTRFRRVFGDYQGPFIVKPVSGRASLHVHVVDDRAGLADAIDDIYHVTNDLVLIEMFLPGREFCIAASGPVTARESTLFRSDRPFTFAALERNLEPGEHIFTSMDVKPITKDRIHLLDPVKDRQRVADLHRLGAEVFREFNLRSIVRVDLREDASGCLQILEANPKPDLKRPSIGVTSLIVESLPQCAMTYEDLILSVFADRLDFLLEHRQSAIRHIVDLLEARDISGAGSEFRFRSVSSLAPLSLVEEETVNELATNRNGGALEATVEASHYGNKSRVRSAKNQSQQVSPPQGKTGVVEESVP